MSEQTYPCNNIPQLLFSPKAARFMLDIISKRFYFNRVNGGKDNGTVDHLLKCNYFNVQSICNCGKCPPGDWAECKGICDCGLHYDIHDLDREYQFSKLLVPHEYISAEKTSKMHYEKGVLEKMFGGINWEQNKEEEKQAFQEFAVIAKEYFNEKYIDENLKLLGY